MDGMEFAQVRGRVWVQGLLRWAQALFVCVIDLESKGVCGEGGYLLVE